LFATYDDKAWALPGLFRLWKKMIPILSFQRSQPTLLDRVPHPGASVSNVFKGRLTEQALHLSELQTT
jgi:hypothetical protein